MLNVGRSIVKNTIFIHEKGGLPNRDPLQSQPTLPTAEILSGKNARAWVSMVLYLKKNR